MAFEGTVKDFQMFQTSGGKDTFNLGNRKIPIDALANLGATLGGVIGQGNPFVEALSGFGRNLSRENIAARELDRKKQTPAGTTGETSRVIKDTVGPTGKPQRVTTVTEDLNEDGIPDNQQQGSALKTPVRGTPTGAAPFPSQTSPTRISEALSGRDIGDVNYRNLVGIGLQNMLNVGTLKKNQAWQDILSELSAQTQGQTIREGTLDQTVSGVPATRKELLGKKIREEAATQATKLANLRINAPQRELATERLAVLGRDKAASVASKKAWDTIDSQYDGDPSKAPVSLLHKADPTFARQLALENLKSGKVTNAQIRSMRKDTLKSELDLNKMMALRNDNKLSEEEFQKGASILTSSINAFSDKPYFTVVRPDTQVETFLGVDAFWPDKDVISTKRFKLPVKDVAGTKVPMTASDVHAIISNTTYEDGTPANTFEALQEYLKSEFDMELEEYK